MSKPADERGGHAESCPSSCTLDDGTVYKCVFFRSHEGLEHANEYGTYTWETADDDQHRADASKMVEPQKNYLIMNLDIAGDAVFVTKDAVLWWGPNSRGYTVDVDKAGRYSLGEALAKQRARPYEDFAVAEAFALELSRRVVPVEFAQRFVDCARLVATTEAGVMK